MSCIFYQQTTYFDSLRIFSYGEEAVEVGVTGRCTVYSCCLHPGNEIGKQCIRFFYVNICREYGQVLLRAKGDGRGDSETGFGVGAYVTLHFYSQLVV